jgi:hypothetical protein
MKMTATIRKRNNATLQRIIWYNLTLLSNYQIMITFITETGDIECMKRAHTLNVPLPPSPLRSPQPTPTSNPHRSQPPSTHIHTIPDQHTQTHTNTHTRSRAPLCEAGRCLIRPSPNEREGVCAFTLWAYAAWSAPRGWLSKLIFFFV